jgi:hypothetical protein
LEAPKFFVFTIGFFRKRIKSQALGMTILLFPQELQPEVLDPAINCHPDRSSEGA